MKNLFKGICIAVILIMAAHRAMADNKYDLFYTDKDMKKIDATTALVVSNKGETVYKCQTVEAKVSKSGTSISLRNVKRHKTEKE